MPGPSEASLRRSERVLGWLVALVVAVTAITSCARIQDKSTDELIALVQGGDWNSSTGRGEACDAAYNLGLRKATEAVDELIAALSGPADNCVALALGQIGDLRAVEPLLTELEQSILGVSLAPEDDKMEFDSADEALVAIGAPAVEPLLTLAGSGDEDTRDLVTYVLGRIRDSRAEPYLLGRLKAPNRTTLTFRRGALEADALVRIFGDQTDRLLPLLQSKETVAIAYGLVGLGQTGTEAALSEALMQYGDLDLAGFYLGAGNPVLRDAALDWAYANGYELKYDFGIPGGSDEPPSWGAIGADGS